MTLKVEELGLGCQLFFEVVNTPAAITVHRSGRRVETIRVNARHLPASNLAQFGLAHNHVPYKVYACVYSTLEEQLATCTYVRYLIYVWYIV